MDPKRKRLYIFLIIGCLIATAIVLLWGLGGSTPSLPPDVTNPSILNTTTQTQTPSQPVSVIPGQTNYAAPAVFPANNNFDTSVLDLSQFKSLQQYQNIQIQPTDLGRDDPFKDY